MRVYVLVYAFLLAVGAAAPSQSVDDSSSQAAESFLRPGRRARMSIFEENPCNKYFPRTPEKVLCNKLRDYVHSHGQSSQEDEFAASGLPVENGVRNVIDDSCMYDLVVVKGVIETAEVYGEIQNMGK